MISFGKVVTPTFLDGEVFRDGENPCDMILVEVCDHKEIQLLDSPGSEELVGRNPLGMTVEVLWIVHPSIDQHPKDAAGLLYFQQNGIPISNIDEGDCKHDGVVIKCLTALCQ